MCVVCVPLERSDLSFIGTQEEVNRLRWEMKRRDGRRTEQAAVFIVHYSKTFQLLKFHSCVTKGEEVSARGIPANRGARRDEAGGGGGARV